MRSESWVALLIALAVVEVVAAEILIRAGAVSVETASGVLFILIILTAGAIASMAPGRKRPARV